MKPGRTQTKIPKGIVEAGAGSYALSSSMVKWVLFSPFLVTLILTVLSTPPFLELHPHLWGENKLVESLQFPIFALAWVQGLVTAWHMLKQMERPYIWLLYGGFALVMFFIAMEEIAWGQQYLGFKAPDFIRSLNVQNEFTFHNVSLLQDRTDFLNLGFGLAAGVGLWLTLTGKSPKVGLPVILAPWLFLIIALSLVGIWVDLFVEVRPINYSIYVQTETAELLIALTGVLYPWLNARAFAPRAPGRSRLARASVIEGALHLTTRDGREISIPSVQVPMSLGIESREAVNLDILQDGTRLRGIDPHEVLHIRTLLETRPARQALTRAGPFPLPKVYAWMAALAGVVSLVWLALIPGDSKNAWVLGLSKTRFAMFLAGIALLILLFYLQWRSARNTTWKEGVSRRLNAYLMKPAPLKTGALLSGLGAVGALLLLLGSFIQVDPYLQGIFSRLAPWFLWSLVLFGEGLFLVFPSLLTYSRLEMAHAERVRFQGGQMVVTLGDGRGVMLPLNQIPELEQAGEVARQEVVLVGDGLRLRWPSLGVEVCVEALLAGSLESVR